MVLGFIRKKLESLKDVKRVLVERSKYLTCENFEDSFYDFLVDLASQDIFLEAVEKYKEELKKITCEK